MLPIAFLAGVVVGALIICGFNRVRRKLISHKMFGKLDEGEPDPTRP